VGKPNEGILRKMYMEKRVRTIDEAVHFAVGYFGF
jgi:hypothetical protein